MPLKRKTKKRGGRLIRGRKTPSIKQGRTLKKILKTKPNKRRTKKRPVKICVRLKQKR